MRNLLTIALLLAPIPGTGVSPAHAESVADAIADMMIGCIDPVPELRIAGCTAAIESGFWDGPELAWAYNNRGVAHRMSGAYAQAERDFTEAIRIDPENPINWNSRGHLRRLNGEAAAALADFDAALARDPGYGLARANRAEALAALGRFGEAAAALDPLLEAAPEDVALLARRGLFRHVAGDNAGALADFDAAIALEPGAWAIWNNRGNALCHLGDVEGAIASWGEALALDPGFAAREKAWLAEQGVYDGPLEGPFGPEGTGGPAHLCRAGLSRALSAGGWGDGG